MNRQTFWTPIRLVEYIADQSRLTSFRLHTTLYLVYGLYGAHQKMYPDNELPKQLGDFKFRVKYQDGIYPELVNVRNLVTKLVRKSSLEMDSVQLSVVDLQFKTLLDTILNQIKLLPEPFVDEYVLASPAMQAALKNNTMLVNDLIVDDFYQVLATTLL